MPRFRRPIIGLLANLVAETRGVAVVEAAIVMPVLAIVIMGTVDVARFGASKLMAQQAVNRGLEMSTMAGPSLAASSIQSEAASQANVSASAVTVTQTLECSGVATSWSSSCTSGQETARYTQIAISTTFTPTFVLGSFAQLWGNSNGVVPLTTTGAIRIQ